MRTTKVNKKLSLRSDGELQMVFLGTGSAFAKTLNPSNLLIIKGDTHILVDFGANGATALHNITGLEVTDIEVVLPTHSHSDHIGGFERLALMNKFVGMPTMNKKKLKAIITEEYQTLLWEESLKGGLAYNQIFDGSDQILRFEDFFDVIRPTVIENKCRQIFEINFQGIQLEIFRTFHMPEGATSWKNSVLSYGLFIDNRVFFSGDTQFDKDLIDLYADRSEIMFHDVQFYTGGIHASLDELKTLPPKIKKKISLFHYNDTWKEFDISGFAEFCKQGVKYIFE